MCLQNEIISESTDANIIELLKQFWWKKNTSEKLTETKLYGSILRSKANIVEYDKNSKYFAYLEKNNTQIDYYGLFKCSKWNKRLKWCKM